MDAPTLTARHPLENGLTLEIWDHSRLVAGDRWLVRLETRIVIPVLEANLPANLKPQAAEIRKILGESLTFSHYEERNFIATHAVADLLADMYDRMAANAESYFGHREFAPRFIRKQYQEIMERRRWQ